MLLKHQRSAHPSKTSTGEMTLSQLPTGATCQVVGVSGGHALVNRLACLGFTPGAEVILLQNYGRGPLIARVRGAHLALGRGEAEKIQVWIATT